MAEFTKTMPVPSDPATTVTIKRIGWLGLHAAKTASRQASAKSLLAMGGAEFAAALKAIRTDAPKDEESAAPDVLAQYDLDTLLVSGVQAWSRPEAPTRETMGVVFDEQDAEHIGRAILALSGVKMPRSEADEKNAGSSSIAT